MKTGDFLRQCNNEDLSKFLTIFVVATLDAMEIGTEGFDAQVEREALFEMLNETIPDGVLATMDMVDKKNWKLS